MVGIQRPAALWCVGEDNQLDFPDYEVALVEPLHDFKNIVNRVLCELPHMATETALQNALTEIVDVIRGSYPHGVNRSLSLQVKMWHNLALHSVQKVRSAMKLIIKA